MTEKEVDKRNRKKKQKRRKKASLDFIVSVSD
jgi:hypothetical protein